MIPLESQPHVPQHLPAASRIKLLMLICALTRGHFLRRHCGPTPGNRQPLKPWPGEAAAEWADGGQCSSPAQLPCEPLGSSVLLDWDEGKVAPETPTGKCTLGYPEMY